MKYVVTLFLLFFTSYLCLPQQEKVCLHINDNPINQNRSITVEWESFVIPVVIHIFHNGEDYGTYPNISESDINDNINMLNNSFNGVLNENMEDSKISFCVSNNDEHEGIIRYNVDTIDWVGEWSVGFLDFPTSEFFFNCLDSLNVDYQNYLNIFVAPYVDNIRGLSYGLYDDNYGGILIQTERFNTNTLVHEVGHYLGLPHTFQGYNNCESALLENDCENEGDGICDTPPTASYSCVNYNNCYDTDSFEYNELVINFMGYSIDCSNKFTYGQIDKMQYTIQNTSRIILTQNICSCSNIVNFECLCDSSNSCPYDLNNNGTVDMSDLLIILGNIFNNMSCNDGDFDGSGYIDTSDLLELLSNMGYVCT